MNPIYFNCIFVSVENVVRFSVYLNFTWLGYVRLTNNTLFVDVARFCKHLFSAILCVLPG